ncbi:MAG: perosamine synthetase [Parcubacteria group bacterium Gr01-1014_31]|nr:MAG: perosamine synthetase [Parcubacteria group bacterium Gr01-1014_31]
MITWPGTAAVRAGNAIAMAATYEQYVTGVFSALKRGDLAAFGGAPLPVVMSGVRVAEISPVTAASLDDPAHVEYLARWRQENQRWYPERFEITVEGTTRWLRNAVLQAPDRLLAWLQTPAGEYVGHLGLFRCNFAERHCEIDSILRGRADLLPGAMTPAVQTLMDWAFTALDLHELRLKVMTDNPRAIRLYERTGFTPTGVIPLYKKTLPDGTLRWVEERQTPGQDSDRSYTVMRCPRLARLGGLRQPPK